jgi:hypothetical protein
LGAQSYILEVFWMIFRTAPKMKKSEKGGGEVKKGSPAQGSAEHPCFPKSFWSWHSQKNSSESAASAGTPCPLRAGGGGSECAMRREHRRPTILKLGVLVHAFVAAAGVLQNGKLKQCNLEVEIS